MRKEKRKGRKGQGEGKAQPTNKPMTTLSVFTPSSPWWLHIDPLLKCAAGTRCCGGRAVSVRRACSSWRAAKVRWLARRRNEQRHVAVAVRAVGMQASGHVGVWEQAARRGGSGATEQFFILFLYCEKGPSLSLSTYIQCPSKSAVMAILNQRQCTK